MAIYTNMDERITLVNLGPDEWRRESSRFRLIFTEDCHFSRSKLSFYNAVDYQGPHISINNRLIDVSAKLSAFLGGLALSKSVYYSALRLIELAG